MQLWKTDYRVPCGSEFPLTVRTHELKPNDLPSTDLGCFPCPPAQHGPSVCIDSEYESDNQPVRLISLIIISAHEPDQAGLGGNAILKTDQIFIHARPEFRSPPVPGTQLGKTGSHHTRGSE